MPSTHTEHGLGRLKRRAEFLAVARTQKKWAMPGMVVQARPHRATDTPSGMVRVGFTASKKVGNAVVRNRVKRRLRACVDEVIGRDGGGVRTDGGLDLVVIGRAATAARPYDALKADLVTCLKKLGALAKGPAHG